MKKKENSYQANEDGIKFRIPNDAQLKSQEWAEHDQNVNGEWDDGTCVCVWISG